MRNDSINSIPADTLKFYLGMEQKMTESTIDYSRYFWQGERVRLRPFRREDAELRFIASLDSPTRQMHMDGIELPTTLELHKASIEKIVDCQDNGGMILFAVENLAGDTVGGVAAQPRSEKWDVQFWGCRLPISSRKRICGGRRAHPAQIWLLGTALSKVQFDMCAYQ
jgi:hypothetical protein